MISTVDDAYRAVVELQHVLEPLCQKPNDNGWAKRDWRSVVSMSMEKSVIEKIDRIERLKAEIVSEMQLISLLKGAILEYSIPYDDLH